ncbi:MAG: hypothetical protein IKN59_04970 [Paludibacteraceae bacterium]|nr:hypothetical protein [Paludibacteraceae bacterium]
MKERLHIVFFALLCLLVAFSASGMAQPGYAGMQSTSSYFRHSAENGNGYYGTTNRGTYSSQGGFSTRSSMGNGSLYQKGKTSGGTTFSSQSAINTILGITSFETEQNLTGRPFAFASGGMSNPGGDEGGDDFTGDDNEKVPLGDAVAPMLLMLVGYALWRRRKLQNP